MMHSQSRRREGSAGLPNAGRGGGGEGHDSWTERALTAKLEPLQGWCAACSTPKGQKSLSKWMENPARSNPSAPKLSQMSSLSNGFDNRAAGRELPCS